MVKKDLQWRFTGDEERALKEILAEQEVRRWAKVAEALAERGFKPRTAQSVRNHCLRTARAERRLTHRKNYCRKCGQLMRGHVCLATTTTTTTSESSPL